MSAPKAIVTDIEGTTSSIDFVHNVLFPYAARELPAYVRSNREEPDIAALLTDIRQGAGEPDADVERLIEISLRWIDEDRKVTALKSLQGCIWEHGYTNGAFRGHVYRDTAPNLRRWHKQGIALYVYSSGSVRAQQLLFGNSEAGDLTPLFSGYFDTRVGGKRESASYRTISQHIGITPQEILFLSDVTGELDAAAIAGMQTVQVARDTTVPGGKHPLVPDFDKIDFK